MYINTDTIPEKYYFTATIFVVSKYNKYQLQEQSQNIVLDLVTFSEDYEL